MSLPEIACESRVESVVVYARGALVTRSVALPNALPSESLDLVVSGVTPLAEPGGVRAELEGGREIIALRARLYVPEAPPSQGALVGRVRALEQERLALEAERVRAAERRAELDGIALGPESDARGRRRLKPVARFGDALAAGELLSELVAELDARLRELDAALLRNERAREAADVAAAQGRSDERASGPQPTYQVVLRLGRSRAEARSLSITYAVQAARWWPRYAARLSRGASQVELSLGALVAQASGEDWSGVRLALSTANLAYDARLPELPSLRLGRAQPPARTGYRAPPQGLDAMFAGFDLAVQRNPPPASSRRPAELAARRSAALGARRQYGGAHAPPSSGSMVAAEPEPEEVAAAEILSLEAYEQIELARKPATITASMSAAVPFAQPVPVSSVQYNQPAPAGAVMPPLAASPVPFGGGMPPMQAASPVFDRVAGPPVPMAAGPGMFRSRGGGRHRPSAGGGGYEAGNVSDGPYEPEAAPLPSEIEPSEGWLDFDTLTLNGAGASRGRLVRGGGRGPSRRASRARDAIESMPAPPHVHDPLATRGAFDHRYDARGSADVPSDGRVHRVALATAEAESRPKLRVVPRESADVFREAEVKNPFDAPLLAGPVDVFVEGALVATAQMGAVDRGGLFALGLGVEDRVRVARNAQVEEVTAWLPGSSAAVEHLVTIDLVSSLGHVAPVEIVERVPVSDDKNVKVVSLGQAPPAEAYDQAERGRPVRGGLRWRLELAPGAKQRVEFRYRITLPAKSEVVGGNRRE